MALRSVHTKLWPRLLSSRCLSVWVPPRPPVRLPEAVDDEQVTKVTRGVGFSVFYSEAGRFLWFWGDDPPIRGGSELGRVQLPGKFLVKQVAAGRRHVVALTTTGEVLSMGLNCFGQCGRPLPPSSSPDTLLTLHTVTLLTPITKVCCGLDHTHFLSHDGTLYSSGWSDDGQTGTGCRGNVATPTEVVREVMSESVRDVQCCADSSLACTESAYYGWGNNEYRQLPIESHDMQVFEPWKIATLPDQSGAEVVAMTIGSSFSTALTRHGDVYLSGHLGGCEPGEGWRLLHRSSEERERGRVVGVRAGLHYLAAVVASEEKTCGEQCLLLWGRHSTVCTSSPSPRSTEMKLPSSLLSWDAGPLDLCLLTK